MEEIERLSRIAFEGDDFIGQVIGALVGHFGCRSIVETGTYLGGTARWLAGLGLPVDTVEIDWGMFEGARARLSDLGNVTCHLGNSPDVLEDLLPGSAKPVLCFLDAHWQRYWPLLDEISVIGKLAPGAVLVVHDCLVPGKPWGFDYYNGVQLDWSLLFGSVRLAYPQGLLRGYNAVAGGPTRGVCYIMPRSEGIVEKLAGLVDFEEIV